MSELEKEPLPDYIEWYLMSKDLKAVPKDPVETPIKESDKTKNAKEQEQIQKLLISLTDEIFNQLDEIRKSGKIEIQKQETPQETFEVKPPRPEAKIEFSDLSWYRKQLGS